MIKITDINEAAAAMLSGQRAYKPGLVKVLTGTNWMNNFQAALEAAEERRLAEERKAQAIAEARYKKNCKFFHDLGWRTRN